MKDKKSKRIILLVDDEASCGFLIKTAKTLREDDIEVILFFSDRPEHEPFMLH